MVRGPGFAEIDLNAHAFSYVGRKVWIVTCFVPPAIFFQASVGGDHAQGPGRGDTRPWSLVADGITFRVAEGPLGACTYCGLAHTSSSALSSMALVHDDPSKYDSHGSVAPFLLLGPNVYTACDFSSLANRHRDQPRRL